MHTYTTHRPILDAHHYLYLASAFMIAAAGYGLFTQAGVNAARVAPMFWWFQNAFNLAQIIVSFLILMVAIFFPRFIHRPMIVCMGLASIFFGIAATFQGNLSGPMQDKITIVLFFLMGSLACFAIVPAKEKPHHQQPPL